MQKDSTILIVEDSPEDYETTVRAFRRANIGNPVVHCADGDDALDFLHGRGEHSARTELPSLVLLDLNLPGTDGQEVLDNIRQTPELRTLPVIMLTTSIDERDVRRCYEAGANTYVKKPVDFPGFLDAVNRMRDFWLNIAVLPRPRGEMARTPLVLIVDDCPEDQEVFRRFLVRGEPPYSVLEAASLEEARGVLASVEPDCMLLDYCLPDGEGLELLAELRERAVMSRTAVVVLTGQGDERIAVEAMRRGAGDYLAKGTATERAVRRAVENAIEQRRLEYELWQAQEVTRSFAASAAHDLKSPLRRIAFTGKYLREHAAERLEPEECSRLDRMNHQIEHLQGLIDALLTFSSVGANEPAVVCETSLDAAAAQALANLQMEVDETNAVVECGSLPSVLAPQEAMTLLLQNLISNGIKFSAPGVPYVKVSATRSNGTCEVTVADRGVGIAPEQLDKAFLPLHKCHPGNFDGHGLGLSTCKRIVEHHDGHIFIRSELGRGTQVTFTLPLADTRRDDSLLRMLLVDDDMDDLEMAELSLRGLFEFERAYDAEEALRHVESGGVDVVLTDYRMPMYDGLWLLEAIRDKDPSVVRAMTSSLPPPELERHRSEDLVQLFVPKIVDRKSFAEQLSRASRLRVFP